MRILNSLDINKGLLRDSGFGNAMDPYEVTEWSTISNLGGLLYSYCALNDPRVDAVDLSTVDFTTARSTLLAEDELAPFSLVEI